MRYKVTCLTPTLVGDGQRLAPIDYMVWRDQVNVLDQRKIFKLLSKGPRLDSYLQQLKRAEKLDFASWGGFAQNFAGRRIPFEHSAMTGFWERTPAEFLFIPTFAAGPAGPFLPATAIKGALRTAVIAGRWSHGTMEQTASRLQTERVWRKVTAQAEADAVGGAGADRLRAFALADSTPVSTAGMKVYLVRVATLRASGDRLELGWKATRGSVDGRRPEEGTPAFAEMAPPGTVFEGDWRESAFLKSADIARVLHWKQPDRAHLFEAANRFSETVLAAHERYAEVARLPRISLNVKELQDRVAAARADGACVLPVGWGGGFHTKSAFTDTRDEAYRALLRQLPFYARAIQTGLPFPKTRRIVFLGNEPAALPGWVRLEAV